MSNDSARRAHSRRSGIAIMGRLIGLIKPLLPIMVLAIILGVVGYLCATLLSVFATYGLVSLLASVPEFSGYFAGAGGLGLFSLRTVCVLLIVMGVARGILHYGEQYCNHYIAFRMLAIIRHKVFAALRRLCPAKLEGRDKGNLISLITSDIELLEVFYAHTISPICIAVLVSLVMVVIIGFQHPLAGVLACVAYLVLGAVVPLALGKKGSEPGLAFRTEFGDFNSFVLDSLRGVDETIQYGGGERQLERIAQRSKMLSAKQKKLSDLESLQRPLSNLLILLFSAGMLVLMLALHGAGYVNAAQVIVAVVAMIGSFGPVMALSSLSNNLNQTLACGDRVLDLLEEEPQVEEVESGAQISFEGFAAQDVCFAYEDEQILKDYSLSIKPGSIVGIHGPSGCGKSTLLKLIMRFWDVDSGSIELSGANVKDIQTASLRSNISYVTQETSLFHDSIASNIAIGKPDATREEIEQAAKKASLHDFIMTLPQGYDSEVGELGDTLSGGERQRIGIARAFLHNASFVLLDEPTSNLDSLNEGIILRSLKEQLDHRTVLLVSHRKSTLGICDEVLRMDGTRAS